MTSKEALNDIRNILYEELTFREDADALIEPIEKDLEVLELLKDDNLLKHLIEKELFETSNSYCGNTDIERESVKDYRNKLYKIKEWLENER